MNADPSKPTADAGNPLTGSERSHVPSTIAAHLQRSERDLLRIGTSSEPADEDLRSQERHNSLTVEKIRKDVRTRTKMRLLGLEPKTYGLKVRCSTN